MQLSLPPAFHGLLEQRYLVKLLVGNHQVDARNVHMHNAPGAKIHVPDFAVPHLPFGESHGRPRCLNQRIREFAQEFVIRWFSRQSDGVTLRFGSVAPSIQHGEYNGFWSFGHNLTGYTASLAPVSTCWTRKIYRSTRPQSTRQTPSAPPAVSRLLPWCCNAPSQCAAFRRAPQLPIVPSDSA